MNVYRVFIRRNQSLLYIRQRSFHASWLKVQNISRDMSPLKISATVTPMFGVTSIRRVDVRIINFSITKQWSKIHLARKPHTRKIDWERASSPVKFTYEILIYEESSFSRTLLSHSSLASIETRRHACFRLRRNRSTSRFTARTPSLCAILRAN